MIVANGTVRFAPVTNIRDMWRTAPVVSESGPTMNPGVSQRNRTGTSNASHSWRKRAALSAPGVSIAPPRCDGLFATTPSGRPSMRASAVIMPGANARRSSSTESVSHSASITARTS